MLSRIEQYMMQINEFKTSAEKEIETAFEKYKDDEDIYQVKKKLRDMFGEVDRKEGCDMKITPRSKRVDNETK